MPTDMQQARQQGHILLFFGWESLKAELQQAFRNLAVRSRAA